MIKLNRQLYVLLLCKFLEKNRNLIFRSKCLIDNGKCCKFADINKIRYYGISNSINSSADW